MSRQEFKAFLVLLGFKSDPEYYINDVMRLNDVRVIIKPPDDIGVYVVNDCKSLNSSYVLHNYEEAKRHLIELKKRGKLS